MAEVLTALATTRYTDEVLVLTDSPSMLTHCTRGHLSVGTVKPIEDGRIPLPCRERNRSITPVAAASRLRILLRHIVRTVLYEELLTSDPEQYKCLLRLDIEQFNHLLALIEPKIVRQDTVMRSLVPAKTRLQVTLLFLASGESQFSLSHQFRLKHSTVNNIILETCATTYEELHHKFLKTPKTEVKWQSIIEGFGAPGSEGDGGVWRTTPLQKAVEKKKAGIPTLVKVITPVKRNYACSREPVYGLSWTQLGVDYPYKAFGTCKVRRNESTHRGSSKRGAFEKILHAGTSATGMLSIPLQKKESSGNSLDGRDADQADHAWPGEVVDMSTRLEIWFSTGKLEGETRTVLRRILPRRVCLLDDDRCQKTATHEHD
ncbi:hypothetical protein HPB51_028388 [Rhipicephalus microplus]|uniref:Uncharacterized protein n=1 Tax=Rhipicephalus microplus TaxID=6941 RepID=A0A9J6CX06_RHIMP|nr:hypothetical protein HPB51_028388 [Rhipicephalus microplus]